MTAKDVYDRLIHFIDNEFAHSVKRQDTDISNLRKKIDWLFITVIGSSLSLIGGLIYLMVR